MNARTRSSVSLARASAGTSSSAPSWWARQAPTRSSTTGPRPASSSSAQYGAWPTRVFRKPERIAPLPRRAGMRRASSRSTRSGRSGTADRGTWSTTARTGPSARTHSVVIGREVSASTMSPAISSSRPVWESRKEPPDTRVSW